MTIAVDLGRKATKKKNIWYIVYMYMLYQNVKAQVKNIYNFTCIVTTKEVLYDYMYFF